MSGHSKWATIKHKKAATDAKRGRAFSRLIKDVTIAAKLGGGDADANPRLRAAIAAAKAENMPNENIDRAIARGTGQMAGMTFEQITFEGYGPGGVAVLVDVTTDNRVRTVNELRHMFSKWGGNLGESGCVSWMFESKGYFTVKKSALDEEALMSAVLDLGAEDFRTREKDVYEIITSPQDFEKIRSALLERKIPLESAELTRLPQNEVPVSEKVAPQVLALMESLEDHEDIKSVYANFNIPDEVLSRIPAS